MVATEQRKWEHLWEAWDAANDQLAELLEQATKQQEDRSDNDNR